MTSSNSGGTASRIRGGNARVPLCRAEAGDQQRIPGAEVMLLWDERGRGCVQAGNHCVDVMRQGADHISSHAQHLRPLVESPEEQPELDQRADFVQPELEAGDDAEVAATAADGPEQIRILIRCGSEDPPVSDDHLG